MVIVVKKVIQKTVFRFNWKVNYFYASSLPRDRVLYQAFPARQNPTPMHQRERLEKIYLGLLSRNFPMDKSNNLTS